MKKTITTKIISLLVASLFLINNLAYGLAPELGLTSPKTQDGIFALGQKLFVAKRGPGRFDFDIVKPKSFTPAQEPYLKDVKLVKSGPPKEWGENTLLQETDIVRAFERFRDEEAQIPENLLPIEVGVFEVRDGELPIACNENRQGQRVLVLHKDFVRMWNDIRKNDVLFEHTFPDGQIRTISLAWGIFYRVAKHEMGDLYKRDNLFYKSPGHFNYFPGRGLSTVLGRESETDINKIAGRYNIVNDAIWAWFLGSYCFANTTRYDNNILEERLNWFFDGKEAQNMHLNLEFPNLLGDDGLRKHAIQIALFLNYHFFSRGTEVITLGGRELADAEVAKAEKYRREYEARKSGITETIFATGNTGDGDTGLGADGKSYAARHESIASNIVELRRRGGINVNVGEHSKEAPYGNPDVRKEQDAIDRQHEGMIRSVHDKLLQDAHNGDINLIGQESDEVIEELIRRIAAWREAGDKHTIILGSQVNASAEAMIGKLTGRTNWRTHCAYGMSRIHIVESYDPSSLEDLLKNIPVAERNQTRIVVVGELDAAAKALIDVLYGQMPETSGKTEQRQDLFNANTLPLLAAGLVDENVQNHIRQIHKGAARKYQKWLSLDSGEKNDKALRQYAAYKMASTIARFAKSRQSLIVFWMYSTVFRYLSSWMAQMFNRDIGSANYDTMFSGEWATQYWHSTMQAVRQAKGINDELERYGFMSIVMLFPYQNKDAVIGGMANYQYRGFGYRFFLKVAHAALATTLRMAKRYFFGVDMMADTPEEVGEALFTFQLASLATGRLLGSSKEADLVPELEAGIASRIVKNEPVQAVEDGKIHVRHNILTTSGKGDELRLSGILGSRIEAELESDKQPTLNKVLKTLSLISKRVQSKVINPYKAREAKDHLRPGTIRREMDFAKTAAQLITNDTSRMREGKKPVRRVYSIAIGGSTFGPLMTDALGLNQGPEIVEVSSIDPEEMAKIIQDIENAEDPGAIELLVISKSGATPETDAVFSTLYEALIKRIATYRSISEKDAETIVAGQVLIITDALVGKLREMVKNKGLRSIDHAVLIGGRWSMFSSVGLIHYFIKGGSENELAKALDQTMVWDKQLERALKLIDEARLESDTTVKDALNPNKKVSPKERREAISLVMEKLSVIPGAWEGVLAHLLNNIDNRDTEVVVGLSRPFEQLVSHKNPGMAQLGTETMGKPSARYYRLAIYGWNGLKSIWNRLCRNRRASVTFFHTTASPNEALSSLQRADQAAYETVLQKLNAGGVPCMSIETGTMNSRNLLEMMFFEYRRLAVMAALYYPTEVSDEGQVGVEQYKKVINSFLLRVATEAYEAAQEAPAKASRLLRAGTKIPRVHTDEIDTIGEVEMDLSKWIEPELADFLTSVIKGNDDKAGLLSENTVRYMRTLPAHEIPAFISNFLANPELRQGSFFHKKVSKIYMDGKSPIIIHPDKGEWVIVANSLNSHENLRSHGSNGLNFQVYRRLTEGSANALKWIADVHIALGSDERVIISNGIITQDYRLKGREGNKRLVEHDRAGESNRAVFSEVGKTLAPGGLSSERPDGYQLYENEIQRKLSTSYRFSDTEASDYNLILNKQGLFTGWLTWSEAVGMAYSAKGASGTAMFMSTEGMWHIADNANALLRESASQEGGVTSQDQVYVYVGSPHSVRQIQAFMDYLIAVDERGNPAVLDVLNTLSTIPADADLTLRAQVLTWLLRLQEGIATIPTKVLGSDSSLLKTIDEIKTQVPILLKKLNLAGVIAQLKEDYIKLDKDYRAECADEFILLGYENALLRFNPHIREGDEMKLVYDLERRFLRLPSLELLQLIASESVSKPWYRSLTQAIMDFETSYKNNAKRRTKPEQLIIPKHDFRKGQPLSHYLKATSAIPSEVRDYFGLASNNLPPEAIMAYEKIIDVYINAQKVENIESDPDLMELRARRPEVFFGGKDGLYVRSLHDIRRLVEDNKYDPLINASGDVSSLLDSIFNPILIHYLLPFVSVIISEENKPVVKGSLKEVEGEPRLALFLDPVDGSSVVDVGGVFGMIAALAYLKPEQDLSKPEWRKTFNARKQLLSCFDMTFGFPRTILRLVDRARLDNGDGRVTRGGVAQFELLDSDEQTMEFRFAYNLASLTSLEEGIEFKGFLPKIDSGKALGFAMGGAISEFLPERGHAELMQLLQDNFGGHYLGYTGCLVSDIGKLLAMDSSLVHGIVHSYAATNSYRHGRYRYWFEILAYALMFDALGGEVSNGYESILDAIPPEPEVVDEPSGTHAESIFASPWISKFAMAFRTNFEDFYRAKTKTGEAPSKLERSAWAQNFLEQYTQNTQAMIDNLYDYAAKKPGFSSWTKEDIRRAFLATAGNIYTSSYRLYNGEVINPLMLVSQNNGKPWEDNADKILALLLKKQDAETSVDAEHPLIKEIREIKLSDFTVPIMKYRGPGSITLTQDEIKSFYGEIISLFHRDKIEILLPQQISLTETMKRALNDIRMREGDDIVKCREFSDEGHLKMLLSQTPEKGTKRIVITEAQSADKVIQLASAQPKLFVGVRSFNVALPPRYEDATRKEKTFFQAKIIMEAILMRLYEKDGTPMVRSVLISMLKNNINGDPAEFLDRLVESEDEVSNPTKAAERIIYCLGKIVSLVEKLAQDFEHMKLIIKEFWTAA